MLSNLNSTFIKLTNHPEAGKLILRIMLGGLMLFHGVNKLMSPDAKLAFIKSLLVAHGLPGFVAYGVFLGEVLMPILLILGVFSRFSAFVILVNMLFAMILVNAFSRFLVINGVGATGMEVDLFYTLSALAIMFIGGGRLSIMRNPNYQ